MFYLLAYIEMFYWLAFPLFLALWCALAWAGRTAHATSLPIRVQARQPVRRYEI